MKAILDIRNESKRKRLYNTTAFRKLAEEICQTEGIASDVELSVLLCDDPYIKKLNRQYREKNEATDVLSFAQNHHDPDNLRILGDIVISLQTVEKHCKKDRGLMRGEIKLLFCHGLLHLIGYTHNSKSSREEMAAKQAGYLNISKQAAWPAAPTK